MQIKPHPAWHQLKGILRPSATTGFAGKKNYTQRSTKSRSTYTKAHYCACLGAFFSAVGRFCRQSWNSRPSVRDILFLPIYGVNVRSPCDFSWSKLFDITQCRHNRECYAAWSFRYTSLTNTSNDIQIRNGAARILASHCCQIDVIKTQQAQRLARCWWKVGTIQYTLQHAFYWGLSPCADLISYSCFTAL